LRLPLGPAWLAERTGAAVLPAACVRDGSGWRLIFRPPLEPDRAAGPALQAWHAAIAAAVGGLIGRWPEQWILPVPLEKLAGGDG
jgi:KDO2-lipid IV(A) lauroyltransferase